MKLRAIAGLLLVGAFLAGRYSAPEKVRVETRTLEVHAKSESETRADRASRRELVVTELVRPDGTRKTTTRTVTERKASSASSSAQEVASKESTSLTESTARARDSLELSLLAGTSLSLGPLIYGLHVSRPLLGPVTMGIWGISSGVAGVSIGLRL